MPEEKVIRSDASFTAREPMRAQRARALRTVGWDELEGFVSGQRKSWRGRKTGL